MPFLFVWLRTDMRKVQNCSLTLVGGLDVCVQGLRVLAYFVFNMHCHYSTLSVDLWDCSDLVKERCLQ
jgi:hypothetical protein